MRKHFMFKVLLTLVVGLFLSVGAFAQQIAVKGIVKDTTGEPVIGANVLVKGTTNGTITDFDGNFQLMANQGDIIVISFIGYSAQELPATAELMNVVLKDDSEMLSEVVVIGYGSVKKSDLTGSVTAIKAEDINRGAVNSPDQMLQGKVPGLLVTPASGDPTGSATIRIRGAASLKATNDPLIVIDGVPVAGNGAGMANPLATVNPNDIESYTVLKDASATAIYGSRASNGVIMITTKKGSGDQVKVSYSSSYSVKQNTSTLDVMTADQYRETIGKVYSGAQLEAIQSMLGNANTDWQDEIYRLGFSTDQNVSVYGNKGGLPFRASLGYNYNEGTLKAGSNQRANASISLSPKFFDDHLSVNANAKAIFNRADYADNGAIGAAISFNPTLPVYFTNADGSIDKTKTNGYWNWMDGTGAANTMSSINPLSLFDKYNINESWRSMGNLQLDYKLHGFEDLRFNLNLGYDFSYTSGNEHNNLGSFLSLKDNPDKYKDYTNQNSNTLLEFYGNYNKEFGIHHLDVMGGYSWQHYYEKFNKIEYYNNNRSEVYYHSPTNRQEYYLVSFFGRINYSIDSKYLFTFSLRDDASSRFSKENRWGLFPSAAFAWNIAEEDFIRENKFFSSMKLRLGWGQTGQQDIGDNFYPYQAKYSISTSPNTQIPWGNGFIYTATPNAYNPNIKWETTTTYNIGLDFGIFGGRINGNVDAYLRKTSDLLNDITTPMGNNFSNTVISNVGNMENKGIEFNLNFIPIEKSDMRWTINVNGTFQDTKITKLTNDDSSYLGVQTGANMGGTGGYTSLHRLGYAPWTYYLYQQAYDENGKAIQNVLVDRDGDGKITESDRYVTGKSIQPKFFYGIGSQFTYKNWDFGFNAHGSVGGYALNKTAMGNSTAFSDEWTKGYINNLSTYVLETGWTKAIDEKQKYSDMFLENATFFRLDDINVGYTFDKIGNWEGDIRVGASVQNVFTITNYSGLDPELTSSDGVDGNIVPRPRLYTIRLNINF